MRQNNFSSLDSKVYNESTTLFSVFKEHFGVSINLARIRMISFLISSLCKVKTVNYERLAIAFDTKSDKDSSLRRIQRFFAHYVLDFDLISKLIFKLIPKDERVGLCLDRTNWKFGQTNIDILALGVVYQGISFPLLFKMLPKQGNSNTKERINLMNKYDKLFGFETVDFLVADREFIGSEWLDYLTLNKVTYHIRIRDNFNVILAKNGTKVSYLALQQP